MQSVWVCVFVHLNFLTSSPIFTRMSVEVMPLQVTPSHYLAISSLSPYSRKTLMTFGLSCLSVRPSVRPHLQLSSHWTNFHEIWYRRHGNVTVSYSHLRFHCQYVHIVSMCILSICAYCQYVHIVTKAWIVNNKHKCHQVILPPIN